MRELVLAIDQGTSSTKCLLADATGAVVASGAAPLGESCPRPGWVEQDPQAIWESVENAVRAALPDTDPLRIAGVGFSTQRESVLLWDRGTGEALSPLLSWQDQRTAPLARAIGTTEVRRTVRRISGLPLDPMFSALKARWLLDTYDPDRKRAEAGEIVLGTVDSWLLSRFGTEPLIEIGNASRTQLLDTGAGAWSEELCALFGVPMAALPRIVASTGPFPAVRRLQPLLDGTPVAAVMGDSHAALFGHGVRAPGVVKATYGTGSSVMGLVGAASERMDPGTCLTIGWQIAGQAPAFAAEGNIRSSGATLKWLSSIFGVSVDALVVEALAGEAAEDEDAAIHLVPAFNGLGAPHWDDAAVAILSGFRLGTPRGALVLAGLRSIAHQITDVVESIECTTNRPVDTLYADGGAAANDALMQMQADLAGLTVLRSPVVGLSAIGAAHMAGLSAGLLTEETLAAPERSIFRPLLSAERRARSRSGWRAAVDCSRFGANAPRTPARMQTRAGG